MSHGDAPLPNVPPDAAERFARDLTALVAAPTPDRPLALAVSGGPDSMAMLALAVTAFRGRVIAATVDHRLRAAASDEAAMVADWCHATGVPHATLAPDRPPAGASIQAQARHVRYALLGDWAAARQASALATAHHADDQAETFLMRAARGSGPTGLAGIRPRWEWRAARWQRDAASQPPGAPADTCLAVVRPLLAWRRGELRAIAAAIPFVDDPSNADPRHDRTAARALLAASTIDPMALAAAAAHCREVDGALNDTVDWLWRTRAVPDASGCTLDVTDLPRELSRRLSRRAIGHVRSVAGTPEGHWSDATNIEPLLDTLLLGKAATQAGVLAAPRAAHWHFRPAPPRRSR